MIRKKLSGEINPQMEGEETTIAGWVDTKRDLGKIIFLKIRDTQGKIQVTVKKERDSEETFKKAKDVTQESVVAITGEIEKTDQTETGIEIKPTEINILNKAETPLPLELEEDVESKLDTRLNQRFIDLRKPEKEAILQIRDSALTAIKESMEKRKFVEMHTPKIISEGAEGGATLFPVKYFEEDAYLAQSPQLYKQILMATNLDRMYEIGNYFRAEKTDTIRHTSEFTMWDFEMAFIDSQEDVLQVLEETVKEVIQHVKENAKPYLEKLDVNLETPETPFKRITYEKARELLKEEGKEIPKGKDLDTEAEKMLGDIMEREGHELYYIIEYPSEEKPFYIMRKDEEPYYSHSFDLDYKGIEITSGGQREHRPEQLNENIEEQGLNPDDFEYYMNAFKYGMPPHGGAGTGFDRVIQQMLELDNIREAIPFPRDLKRLKP